MRRRMGLRKDCADLMATLGMPEGPGALYGARRAMARSMSLRLNGSSGMVEGKVDGDSGGS